MLFVLEPNIDYGSLVGIPYNEGPIETHSVTSGFNCLSFVMYLYGLHGIHEDVKDLRKLRKKFVKTDKYAKLDIPVSYLSILSIRHVGMFINENEFIHCCIVTNGVAICNINNPPWRQYVREVLRYKNED